MNLGVVGFGNLGRAFVKGIIKRGKFKSQDIYVTAKTEETLEVCCLELMWNPDGQR